MLHFPRFVAAGLILSCLHDSGMTRAQGRPGESPSAERAKGRADRASPPASNPDDDPFDRPFDKPTDAWPPRAEWTDGLREFDRIALGDDFDEHAARQRLGSMLDDQLMHVGLYHELSPAEKEKLLLAGRGDIQHFLRRVREQRKEFAAAGGGIKAWRKDYDSIRWQNGNGPFVDTDSVFSKVLRKIKGDKQAAPRTSPPRVR